MASQTPYARLVGTWQFWLAPVGEAKPSLDAAPAGNWVALGHTEGEQMYRITGRLTALRDNHSTGPRKHIRPEEGCNVQARLVHLTLEDRAKVRSMATSDVSTTTSGALNVKRLPNKRGYIPTRYALLARGGALEPSNSMSPYGAWPAQLWIPQGVFDGEPEEAYAADGSPAIQFQFVAEVDSTQSAGNEFGYLEVQSS
ncbi:MAG: hypothetical protein KF770_10695 [Anaerolineae bacterium]|nr:hypothetical protein [Anaerolineae bacterium]